jgi:hypothetical protein
MESDSEHHDLLNDVFEDAAPPAFRAGLLLQTLQEVQRRKRRRQLGRHLLTAACVVGVLVLAARFLPLPRTSAPPRADLLLVHSQPLGGDMIVKTERGNLGAISSSAFAIALVRTLPAEQTFAVIGDDQLFALLAGRPAALVRLGPSQAELVLLNPADESGFPIQ